MTLDQFPIQEMANILTEKYIQRKEYFSHSEIARFIKELNDSLVFKYPDNSKFEYLKERINIINDEFTEMNLPCDLDIWGLKILIKERILNSLNSVELNMLEFSNQPNIDIIQDCIERSNFYIDELGVLIKGLTVNNRNDWQENINLFISKSGSNHSFLEHLSKRFHHDLNDESDNQVIDSFGVTFEDFYDHLALDILKIINEGGTRHSVLVLHIEGEPILEGDNKEFFIEPKSTNEILILIQEYVAKRIIELKDWIKIIEEIKKRCDKNAEDINFDKLVRELTVGEWKIKDNEEYYKIIKRDIIIQKLKEISLGKGDFIIMYSHNPEVENLVLIAKDKMEMRGKLTKCLDILINGRLISECDPMIFISLFEKERFIGPVNWLGYNNSLRYFIMGIKDKLKENTISWEIVSACFLNNNKAIKSESVRNPQSKPISDNVKLILDKAIDTIVK